MLPRAAKLSEHETPHIIFLLRGDVPPLHFHHHLLPPPSSPASPATAQATTAQHNREMRREPRAGTAPFSGHYSLGAGQRI